MHWVHVNYIVALGIPLLLIGVGGVAKKLVRGTAWKSSDFFLGVELSLSALTSSLIFISDSDSNTNQDKIMSLGVFTVVCLFIFLFVMAVHQDWENRSHNSQAQLFWLGGLCNLLGIGLIFIFVLLVKGVH